MNTKKKRKFKKVKASFTIEAAVIVPLTMVLVTAVLTIAFVLHDRVILSTVSIFEVMDRAADFGEEAEAAEEHAAEILRKRLITVSDTEVSVEQTDDGITARMGGTLKIPLRAVRALIGDGFEQADTIINISNLNGRQALIKYKTLCDGIRVFGREKEE